MRWKYIFVVDRHCWRYTGLPVGTCSGVRRRRRKSWVRPFEQHISPTESNIRWPYPVEGNSRWDRYSKSISRWKLNCSAVRDDSVRCASTGYATRLSTAFWSKRRTWGIFPDLMRIYPLENAYGSFQELIPRPCRTTIRMGASWSSLNFISVVTRSVCNSQLELPDGRWPHRTLLPLSDRKNTPPRSNGSLLNWSILCMAFRPYSSPWPHPDWSPIPQHEQPTKRRLPRARRKGLVDSFWILRATHKQMSNTKKRYSQHTQLSQM